MINVDNKDYSGFTSAELLAEEKKIRKSEIVAAGMIGFLTGVIVYGIVKNGFGFLYSFVSLFLAYIVYKNSKKQKIYLKQVREELNKRNVAQ